MNIEEILRMPLEKQIKMAKGFLDELKHEIDNGIPLDQIKEPLTMIVDGGIMNAQVQKAMAPQSAQEQMALAIDLLLVFRSVLNRL